ncbi:MarR family transcriptional regulator [Synechocystis sp. PCC 7509]|uniref:MarR family transcriptional regulator n=1 Tax=Synechocystis sp. PCC 7509 TaxID=927677 RepID=UPI0002ACFE4B|nr:MarR family transcriptional regulator [Synechocystis sp. PCC 7509]
MTYINDSSPNKTKVKFYALRTGEHLRACKELTPAQRDIYYYLMTLDPDGNGMDINSKEIAEQLGLSKFTVCKSLKALDQLGWIELEKITNTIRISIN